MKKVLSFILSAAVAVGSVSVPVLAQADEENRDYIIDHDYSDAAYDTTEEVFATGRYYVGGIGDGKDTGAAEDDNISAAVEDGRLVLTAKSAAERKQGLSRETVVLPCILWHSDRIREL